MGFSIQALFQELLKVIIPPRCLPCTQIVEIQGTLCASCWSSLTFIEDPMCIKCGFPFEYQILQEMTCGGCIRKAPLFKQARALLAYDDSSKKMILSFKHGDNLYMALYFAEWLKRIVPLGVDMITPVLLHWTRLFKRCYNQADLIANELGKLTKIQTIPDLLVRFKKTFSQGGFSRLKRYKNVKGAFKIPDKYITSLQKKHILLIDDVFTTGATVTECAKILKKTGAHEVSILTLARVVHPQRIL